ncbi:unnamed protein product [Darwinula stevensoni]|uniref:Bestrophin homolog n=1 Tax=Darwinula stevensoni TaxID=69355 RepID=A0A7R8X653_9CRUS|nr:unnamed protein product [Darwinula stevensoni]CAG0879093.1 unnamed protein product [Darwinula stevensoni]
MGSQFLITIKFCGLTIDLRDKDSLPCNTMEDVTKLCDVLKNSSERNALVLFHGKVSGKHEAGVMREMIRTLMTDNVAQHLFVLGEVASMQKEAFKPVDSLTSSRVNLEILYAFERMGKYPEFSRLKQQMAVVNHLRAAPWRLKSKHIAQWKGSVYKQLGVNMMIWVLLYYLLSCIYRFVLLPDQRIFRHYERNDASVLLWASIGRPAEELPRTTSYGLPFDVLGWNPRPVEAIHLA